MIVAITEYLVSFFLIVFAVSPFAGRAAEAGFDSTGAVEVREWPSLPLRGYGKLFGTYARWDMPGGSASVLCIRCENPDKAKIVHFKYLSDLGVLPGVRDVVATPAGFSYRECGPGVSAFPMKPSRGALMFASSLTHPIS